MEFCGRIFERGPLIELAIVSMFFVVSFVLSFRGNKFLKNVVLYIKVLV